MVFRKKVNLSVDTKELVSMVVPRSIYEHATWLNNQHRTFRYASRIGDAHAWARAAHRSCELDSVNTIHPDAQCGHDSQVLCSIASSLPARPAVLRPPVDRI